MAGAVVFVVANGAPGVAVGLQPGPRQALELIEHPDDLRRGGCVLDRERNHAAGVAVQVLQGLRHLGHPERVAPEDRHPGPLAAEMVFLAGQVAGGTSRRPGAMRQELDVHPGAIPWAGPEDGQ